MKYINFFKTNYIDNLTGLQIELVEELENENNLKKRLT